MLSLSGGSVVLGILRRRLARRRGLLRECVRHIWIWARQAISSRLTTTALKDAISIIPLRQLTLILVPPFTDFSKLEAMSEQLTVGLQADAKEGVGSGE